MFVDNPNPKRKRGAWAHGWDSERLKFQQIQTDSTH